MDINLLLFVLTCSNIALALWALWLWSDRKFIKQFMDWHADSSRIALMKLDELERVLSNEQLLGVRYSFGDKWDTPDRKTPVKVIITDLADDTV